MTGEATEPHFAPDRLTAFAEAVIEAMGTPAPVAAEVATHLVEAELRGFYSHGVMRLAQYDEWARRGLFEPGGEARLCDGPGPAVVDGGNGFGMPAMRLGTDEAVRRARDAGIAAFGVVNVGHTGRIGAFAERAAAAGCFAMILGGGGRAHERQVAPHGGLRATLPTNPYAFALPGGEGGPVAVDFATAAGAGGKIAAAHYAGRPLPPGLCIDARGRPTVDPEDYRNGGALLPMAGPKGYGMALIAEILGNAMLGPARHGMNWLGVVIDLGAWCTPDAYRNAAEACLAEVRACPPAPGFVAVEIPGQREQRLEARNRADGVAVPQSTVNAICATARALGVDPGVIEAVEADARAAAAQ